MSPARFRWAVPAAWACALLWLGAQDGDDLPSTGIWAIPGIDKVMHAGAYGILGILTAWAARPGSAARAAVLGFCAALVIGALDETGQSMTDGRFASLADLAADLVGGALGAAGAHWILARFIPRRKG